MVIIMLTFPHPISSHLFFERYVDYMSNNQSHLIVIASHVLRSWSRKTYATYMHVLIFSVLRIALTRAVDNYHFVVWRGVIHGKPSLVTFGACVIS